MRVLMHIFLGTVFSVVLLLGVPNISNAQGTGAIDAAGGTYGAGMNGFVALSKGFVPLSDNFAKLFGGPTPDLGSFINAAFRAALSLGAIFAVMRIAWAGFKYMTSDGGEGKSHAKEILGNVVIGILILMGIWLILTQINPQILSLKALKLEVPGTTTGS